MTDRASVQSVAAWLGIAAAAVLTLHDRFALVDNRVLLGLAACLIVAGGVATQRRARGPGETSASAADVRRRMLGASLLLGVLSVAIVVVRVLLVPQRTLRDDLVAGLVPPLLGWSVVLLLFSTARAGPAAPAPSHRHPGRILVLIVGLAFAAIWISTLLIEHWTSIDEVLYGLQAHRFAQGDAVWRLDPAMQRFFKLPLMVATTDGIFAQYPPGYPAILGLFVRLGVPALCGATLGAIAVLATYRLARIVGSVQVGLLSASLLATHDLFLRWAALNMSHVAALTAAVAAACILLGPRAPSARERALGDVAAGSLIGIAVVIRPVTGLALAVSIWAWLLLRSWGRWRDVSDATATLVLGVALPFAALLAYNAYTTGSPLRLGYQTAAGHLNDLGFGPRGIILYDRDVRPVLAADPFTPSVAAQNEAAFVLWPLARDLLPVWTVLPLLALAYAHRAKVRWGVVAAFAVLPLTHFFYYANGERFYVELLPYLAVGIALLLSRIREMDAPLGSALIVFLLGANVVSSAGHLAGDVRQRARHPSDSDDITRALLDVPPSSRGLLVFVRNPPLAEPLLVGLSKFNFAPFPGPIVVARDLGEENAQLICRLPAYRVRFAESSTPSHGARLLPAANDSIGPSNCGASPLLTSLRPHQ